MNSMDPRSRARFVDDAHLRPRDNSGGSMTPMTRNGEFGDGGKVTGGEPANMRGDNEDEMMNTRPSRSSGSQRGMIVTPRKAPQNGQY